jgi:CBF1 interacting corepressor
MSLRFLLTKSWHTANLANQRKVFEAELEQDFLKKREAERQKVFEQERAFEETRKLMIEQGKGGKEIDLLKGKGGALSFMYEPPPGYAQHENSVENPAVLQAHQERLAAKGLTVNAIGNNDDAESRPNIDPETMKPLGLDIRNVRCVKCKQWGHQMGDSACPMKAVSVETERFRQQIEDPLMVFDRSRGAAVTDRLVLRQTLDGIHGGEGADSANQQASLRLLLHMRIIT